MNSINILNTLNEAADVKDETRSESFVLLSNEVEAVLESDYVDVAIATASGAAKNDRNRAVRIDALKFLDALARKNTSYSGNVLKTVCMVLSVDRAARVKGYATEIVARLVSLPAISKALDKVAIEGTKKGNGSVKRDTLEATSKEAAPKKAKAPKKSKAKKVVEEEIVEDMDESPF